MAGHESTAFGFRDIDPADKAAAVGAVFDSVAPRYDLMNDAMSAGLHRAWKRLFVETLAPRGAVRLLDLASGTGDIALRLRRRAPRAEIIASDINPRMLAIARRRAARADLAGLRFLVADAEALPLEDRSVDAVTIAFGIRNCTHIEQVLAEARRVLRPGGRFLCLEFSRLAVPGLDRLYDAYSFKLIPRLGQLIARDGDAYRYLVESIRRFPDQDRFTDMARAAGLERVRYRDLAGGIAAIHGGWRL